MPSLHATRSTAMFSSLRRFAARRPDVEVCELCGAEVGERHRHLIEPERRRLACACEPCAMLFSGHGSTRFKQVPQRLRRLRDFQLADGQWEALAIPIGLAFFFHSSPAGKVVAFYPSPAGATESTLPLDCWTDLSAQNPVLRDLEPDVEALLVNRLDTMHGTAQRAYYVAPIDVCYRLVGLIRAKWRGFSGGSETWDALARFFAELDAAAEPFSEVPRA